MHKTTDITIVGAGIAGCIAALALAPTTNIILLDQQAQPPNRIGECLAPAANRILARLGLLKAMEDPAEGPRYLRTTGMASFWGSDRVQYTDHLRNPDGYARLLDRAQFEAFLRRRVKQAGVTCLWPAQFTAAEPLERGWRLHVTTAEGEHQIETRYVIDAAGRKAPFARKQGVTRENLDRLVACWADIPNRDPRVMGMVASAEDGWWYTAPLPNGRRVLAYQTDSDLIPTDLHKDPEAFLQLAQATPALAAHLDGAAPDLRLNGTVAANSSRLTQPAGRNWAALGDAAVAFDPLSSQGMFNAMATAMQLTDLIKETGIIGDPTQNDALVPRYNAQIDRIWQHYLKHRRMFYQMEAARPSTFWTRRIKPRDAKSDSLAMIPTPGAR